MKPKNFDDLYREAETRDEYWIAGIVQELTEEIFRLMEEQKLSRAELARRLGTSPAYVTKILRGNANFTLASLVKLSRALQADLRVELVPRKKAGGKSRSVTSAKSGSAGTGNAGSYGGRKMVAHPAH